jgi:hypothetical protein
MDKYADWDGLQPVHAAVPDVAPGVSVRQRWPARKARSALREGARAGALMAYVLRAKAWPGCRGPQGWARSAGG